MKEVFGEVKKALRDIGIVILILLKLPAEKLFIPPTAKSRRRVAHKIKKKYPSHKVERLSMDNYDWSSSLREAKDGKRATCATAVLKSGDEQRTLHFSYGFGGWKITHDAPDSGKNVPEGEYFLEESVGSVGKRINMEEHIRGQWVIPKEDGRLYHRSGEGEYRCYSYRYIKSIYRTEKGSVYAFDGKTPEWEKSELTYSQLDYYGNYQRIPKERAEGLISGRRREISGQTAGR